MANIVLFACHFDEMYLIIVMNQTERGGEGDSDLGLNPLEMGYNLESVRCLISVTFTI